MEGYLKLHRQLLDSTQFADPIRLKIWIWCLIKANHKSKAVPLKNGKGYVTVSLKRGQFIFGRNKASEELDIAGSTLLRHLQKLESEKAIKIQPNSQYSVITVCKYGDYQSFEEQGGQPTDNQRTTNGQPTDTTNNVLNKDIEGNINIPETSSGNNGELDFLLEEERKVPLYTAMVDVWFKDTHPDFVFAGVDGKKIKSIISKIKTLLAKYGRANGEDEILSFFRLVCQNLPEYFKDKDLKVIDSDFNQIIQKIKDNQNGKQITSTSKQSTYADAKAAFGA